MADNCIISWSGETVFAPNTAETGNGGAVFVQNSSQALGSGKTTFANNRANNLGGGIFGLDSTVSWSGDTTFASNTAQKGSGGGVVVNDSSQVLG